MASKPAPEPRQESRGFVGLLVGAVLALIVGGFIGDRLGPSINDEEPLPENAGPLSVGQKMEFTGPTLDGKNIDLRDLRGKLVLVDFWATWCGPCVAELPRVQRLYERNHDSGFEIVSISLDHSRAALVNFVKEKKIPWPQIFYPGGENPLAQKYGIDSIPRMILVDREGKILDNSLRGSALDVAVANALNGDPSRFLAVMLACGAIGAVVGMLGERIFRRILGQSARAKD